MDERPLVHAPELAGAGGWINVAEPLSLKALRGKVVLLDFWTFCCINCLHIIEELRPLEAAYPNELVVIGVHSPKFPQEHDHAAVERAVARHRIRHPVLDDPDMITWSRYGVRAWPTFVLIDARGYVRWAGSGEGYGAALMKAVGALIEEAHGQGTLNVTPAVRGAGVAALGRSVPAGSALAFPGKVASDGAERLAISDTGHDRVLIVTLDGQIERELTGLYQPQGVLFDGNRLVVCNTGADEVVAYTLAPVDDEQAAGAHDGGSMDARFPADQDGASRRAAALTRQRDQSSAPSTTSDDARAAPQSHTDDVGRAVRIVLAEGISSPWDMVAWEGGLAVAEAGRHRLWRISAEGTASVLAGTSGENLVDGPAEAALLAQPSGLAVAADGALLFADSEVSALRRLKDGRVETLVGKGLFEWGTADGDRETARLQHPLGVAALADGRVFVADTFNSLLRLWQDGHLSTLSIAGLDEPGGLCALPDGRLAVADTNNHRILLVNPNTDAAEALALPAPVDPDNPPLRELRSNATVTLELSLDLAGDDLDPGDGPPVRVSVAADPPSLLASGPRAWALDVLPARVELATAVGEGIITLDVQAASCLGDECRLHRRRITLPVRLGDAERGVVSL